MLIRYIRDWVNGNTVNAQAHWIETQAVDFAGVNQALGKSVSGLYTINGANIITDGLINSNYANTGSTSGLQWVSIDLGDVIDINFVKVWHYYPDARTYHNTKTEVSKDGTNWVTVYDSAVSGEYKETSLGAVFDISRIGLTLIRQGNQYFKIDNSELISLGIPESNDQLTQWFQESYSYSSSEIMEACSELNNAEVVIGSSYSDINVIYSIINGILVKAHPVLNTEVSLDDLEIGDCIPCRYTATSGVLGTFMDLGSCVASEIPTTGTATPDGLFYFIKVAPGLLIADRVVQNALSWTTLANAGFVEGTFINLRIFPKLTSTTVPDPYKLTSSLLEWSTFPMWKAFDGVESADPGWIPSTQSPGWIKIDVGTKKEIDTIRIVPEYGSDKNPSRIKNWVLSGSNDDTTYNEIVSGLHENASSKQQVNFSPVSYRFYKFDMIDTYQAYGIGELTLLNSQDNLFIRSLTGGCSYVDSTGNSATSDQQLGGWPSNNEFDKYLVKSDLNGKITPNDIKIWNHDLLTICQDTPKTSLYSSSYRIGRRINHSNNDVPMVGFLSVSTASYGFRPVVQYVDKKLPAYKRPTTIFY